jgi:ABC-type uncharacterized transport system substrate-binding protein
MNLAGLAQRLAELGLIENKAVPTPVDDDALSTWQWLSTEAGGDRLIFLKDGFFSAGWEEKNYPELKQAILDRLEAGDVDLILAFGTVASLMVATNEHDVAVMSITSTDPVSAGISLTNEDSGLDHVHVQVEAGQIERQLSMFHSIFGFSTLGVPYDSTDEGKATMGIETIERTAAERGFTIVPCVTSLELASVEESNQNLVKCLEELSQKSEAVYLTVSNGMVESSMEQILAPLIQKKLPTFSQKGPSETKLGVLMSLGEDDYTNSGRFGAEVLKEIIEGKIPRSIPQIYAPPLTMALNFQTALDIGWDPPFDLLAVVDELYVSDWSLNHKSDHIDPVVAQ